MELGVRMEGVTLSVSDVERSVLFYRDRLGFNLEWDAAPQFAMLRIGGGNGGTVGLLEWNEAKKDGSLEMTSLQSRAIHVELSTDDLDGLYQQLISRGVKIDIPPHDEPWERSMTLFDPDGYSVEFSQGRRGKQSKDRVERHPEEVNVDRAKSSSFQLVDLPKRVGPRPRTTAVAPHSQLDQQPDTPLSPALIETLSKLPDVTAGKSLRAPPGTLGLQLTASHARDCEEAFLIDREFAHVHADDHAMHMILPEPLRSEAIAAGWAEQHPWAGRPTTSPDTVMVYAPRNEVELATVIALARASWRNAHR